MKKVIIILVSVLLSIPAYLYLQVPHQDLKILKKGFVEVEYKKKTGVFYLITVKRPGDWVSLKNISRKAVEAIVISEDWAFYEHDGFDFGQLKEALTDNAVKGKKLRGASTISQQLVKNLFLQADRSFVRKGREAITTYFMERELSKKKILEVYLNIIEYGEGLYGIGNASKFYFKKSPKNLTAKEGAFLAMLLPSPKKHAQSFRDHEMTPFAKSVIDRILAKLLKKKVIKKGEYEAELAHVLFTKKDSGPKKNRGFVKKKGLRGADGSEIEESYKIDTELLLDGEPTFNESDKLDDLGNVQEEFSAE